MSLLTEDNYKKDSTICRQCYDEKTLEHSGSERDIFNKQTSSSKLDPHTKQASSSKLDTSSKETISSKLDTSSKQTSSSKQPISLNQVSSSSHPNFYKNIEPSILINQLSEMLGVKYKNKDDVQCSISESHAILRGLLRVNSTLRKEYNQGLTICKQMF